MRKINYWSGVKPVLGLMLALMLTLAACGGNEAQDAADDTEPAGSDDVDDSEGTDEADTDASMDELIADAEAEGGVMVYISSPADAMRNVFDDFEAEYPGVAVEFERVVGAAQYERFLQEEEANQHVADVIGMSDQVLLEDLIDRGHLAEYTSPAADRFEIPQYQIPGYAYSVHRTTAVVAYNANNVTPEEVELLQTWDGILDPVFKGRIAMRPDLTGISYAQFLYFITDGEEQYGESFFEALAGQEPTIYQDSVAAGQAIVSGEQDINPTLWDGFASTQYEQGAPIRVAFPEPATASYGNTWWGISESAPNPAAAELLMNWLTSEDGAASINVHYDVPGMTGVEDSRAVNQEEWYEFPSDEIAWQPDMEKWATERERLMGYWSKYFGPYGAS
ncbi:MAG: extracellular solute-binding protein [Dehalococcoidia bacterium]